MGASYRGQSQPATAGGVSMRPLPYSGHGRSLTSSVQEYSVAGRPQSPEFLAQVSPPQGHPLPRAGGGLAPPFGDPAIRSLYSGIRLHHRRASAEPEGRHDRLQSVPDPPPREMLDGNAARATRAVSSGTGGSDCCRRSDMGDLRVGSPLYTVTRASPPISPTVSARF